MTYISVLCMFGDETTNQFELVYRKVCECPWNELSLEAQKLFPIILMAVERPVYLKGFMSVKLTREFMKAVSDINSISIVSCINSLCVKFFLPKIVEKRKNVTSILIFVCSFKVTNTGFSYFMMLRQFNR